MPRYLVVWDNGLSASGEFPDRFSTREAAEDFGQAWADESNLQEFGTTEPEGDCYTFDVVEEIAGCDGECVACEDYGEDCDGSDSFTEERRAGLDHRGRP